MRRMEGRLRSLRRMGPTRAQPCWPRLAARRCFRAAASFPSSPGADRFAGSARPRLRAPTRWRSFHPPAPSPAAISARSACRRSRCPRPGSSSSGSASTTFAAANFFCPARPSRRARSPPVALPARAAAISSKTYRRARVSARPTDSDRKRISDPELARRRGSRRQAGASSARTASRRARRKLRELDFPSGSRRIFAEGDRWPRGRDGLVFMAEAGPVPLVGTVLLGYVLDNSYKLLNSIGTFPAYALGLSLYDRVQGEISLQSPLRWAAPVAELTIEGLCCSRPGSSRGRTPRALSIAGRRHRDPHRRPRPQRHRRPRFLADENRPPRRRFAPDGRLGHRLAVARAARLFLFVRAEAARAQRAGVAQRADADRTAADDPGSARRCSGKLSA